ncbi:MAG TPA: outer membrane beta-barrel protein [Acidobacteriota bacterium]
MPPGSWLEYPWGKRYKNEVTMKLTKKSSFRSIFLLVCLFASLGMVCPGAGIPAHKFMAAAGVNVFRAASGDYRQLYGQTAFMPEIKLACMVYKNFSVWGGFGLVSRQGHIEEVDESARIKQTFLSFGVGYAHKLSGKLRLRGELGLAYVSFKEEALDVTQKGSGLGWKIGADLDYFIGKRLFVTLAAAYSQVGDETEAGKVELGGAQAGAGVGLIF